MSNRLSWWKLMERDHRGKSECVQAQRLMAGVFVCVFPHSDFPIRGMQIYDGPINMQNCTFRKYTALEGRHTSAFGFRLNNSWQSCPNNNVTDITFDQVPVSLLRHGSQSGSTTFLYLCTLLFCFIFQKRKTLSFNNQWKIIWIIYCFNCRLVKSQCSIIIILCRNYTRKLQRVINMCFSCSAAHL